jgi:tungstate transport system ATP-binding protein
LIEIDGVTKKFGNTEILKTIRFVIRDGEIFTLIGPSGSGKTTLLRLINLLDTPTTGKIVFDGTETSENEKSRLSIRRRMGMVFQKPAMLNTTVAENIAFGLKFRGVERSQIEKKVQSVLELVGLPGFSGRRAITLSGGEMQRVSIARAMVTEPEVLLLDEPTANLDPLSSEIIEELILKINKDLHTTIVLSTHDMVQGQRLADRIGVIIEGRMVQVGTSEDIFYRPFCKDIARLVGIDTTLNGVVTANDGGHAEIRIGDFVFEAITTVPAGQRVVLYIRPEEVTLILPNAVSGRTSARNQLFGSISRIVPFGPFIRVTVDCGSPLTALITRRSCNEMQLGIGTQVIAVIKATAIHVIPDSG